MRIINNLMLAAVAATVFQSNIYAASIINKHSVIINNNSNTNTMTSYIYSSDTPMGVELKVGSSLIKAGSLTMDCGEPVYIQNKSNCSMLPLRAVSTAIGSLTQNIVNVQWQSDVKTAEITYNNNKIIFKPDSSIMEINGEKTIMDAAAEIKNQQLFIPLRALAEALGAEVEWDSNTKKIYLKK